MSWLWWAVLIGAAIALWRHRNWIRSEWCKGSGDEKARRQGLDEVHAWMRKRGIEPQPKAPPLPGRWHSKYKSYTCLKCNDYTVGGLSVPLRQVVADGKCPKCAAPLRLRRCDHPDVAERRGGIFQCRACGQIVECVPG